MRLHRTLGLITLGLAGALVRCSSDDFTTTTDAGDDGGTGVDVATDRLVVDAPGETTTTVDAAVDAPIDTGPPAKCDPKKPFATPTKVSLNALDVVIDVYGSFRIDPAEKHVWMQKNGLVRQYDVGSANTLTHDTSIPDLAVAQGFAVSANGLELIAAQGGGLVRHARGSITSAWGTGTLVNVPLNVPDGAAFQQFHHPYHLGNGPTFYFGRFVYYPSAPSEWDVVRMAASDAGAVLQPDLHAGNYAFTNNPVLADDLTLYFARWGATPYPHIARSTRPNANAAWAVPTDVTLGALPVTTNDTLYPYAVTPDECALYFGYSPAVDGAISLNGPFTIYVARRPL